MGLQDYTYRVKAQSGDTTIHDEEGVSGDMSGGTQTLVDMGSGDYAWQIASGRASVAVPAHAFAEDTVGGGITIAVRMAITSYDASSFAFLAGFCTDATPSKGMALGQSGTNVVRSRWIDTGADTLSMLTVNNAVRTYVLRATIAGGLDKVHAWVSGVTGSGDTADYISSGQNYSTGTSLDTAFLGSSGSTVRVSDFVIWPEELTDAQCHAIANDLRGTLDTSGAVEGDLAATEAADVAALTGDVIITGTIAATEAADTAAFSGGSTPVTGDLDATEASDTAAAAGTVRNPRLVIGPLKNNTGTLLASETGATVYVYQTSGAHVVTKSSQTTDGSAIMTVSDAALAAGTTYRFVIVLSGGAEGMDKLAAA